jgi:L-ascorbate metabolism protein UlaG (beta-lactamase superfamily)
MQIFWHGLSCVRIETSVGKTESTLVTDPYGSESGLRFPRTLKPDLVVLSHQDRKRFALDAFEDEPFVVSDPGEFEVKGMFVFGTPLAGEDDKDGKRAIMYRFEVEGMSIGFLGGVTRVLTEQELGKLENIDILLLPVGGGDTLSPKQAIEIINLVEPRIVIPLDHHVEGLKKERETADAFCKTLGVCKRQDANKLKITRKDLPAEDVIITVLERA